MFIKTGKVNEVEVKTRNRYGKTRVASYKLEP